MQMYGPKQGLRTLPRAKSQIFLEALFRSLYIIKRFRRRRRIKNPEGGGGGAEAGLFCSPKAGFVRSLGLFDSTDSGF